MPGLTTCLLRPNRWSTGQPYQLLSLTRRRTMRQKSTKSQGQLITGQTLCPQFWAQPFLILPWKSIVFVSQVGAELQPKWVTRCLHTNLLSNLINIAISNLVSTLLMTVQCQIKKRRTTMMCTLSSTEIVTRGLSTTKAWKKWTKLRALKLCRLSQIWIQWLTRPRSQANQTIAVQRTILPPITLKECPIHLSWKVRHKRWNS